jgi:DNA gyrase subunit A
MKDEDFVDKLFIASTHDTILCFSSFGKVYWKKVYELPQAGRAARGKPIVNLLPLEAGERINAILPIREYEEDKFIFFATANGTVKKTSLLDFSRQRASGIIAIDLRDGNELIGVDITDGSRDVMLFTTAGKVIRFNENNVRPMGRSAAGVRGIKVGAGQKVVSMVIADEGAVLTATANGYGKRTDIEQYPVHGRGGQGVVSIQVNERNGDVVGAVLVDEDNEIMLISDGGTLVRTRVKEISVMGRNTQGVTLIGLSEDEKLVGLERIVEDENGAGADADDSGANASNAEADTGAAADSASDDSTGTTDDSAEDTE